MEEKIKNLIDFSQGILNGEDGSELYIKYQVSIGQIEPKDLFLVEHEQLKMGYTPKQLLTVVDKLINAFYKSLSDYAWKKPKEGTFLYYLMLENRGLEEKLDGIKACLKEEASRASFKQLFLELEIYNAHMQKLENILFPYLEKVAERYEGIKIMWSLHDDLRLAYKLFVEKMETMNQKDFMKDLGVLFFYYNGLIKKQEFILFPIASEILDKDTFDAMQNQSFDYDYAFIEKPVKNEAHLKSILGEDGKVHMATGILSYEQIETMINTLPVDITLVNEKDEVAFFSRPKERFFPRSLAIIGRNVRNCHPPESVHVVEKIIERFRNGERDQENFWIQMKGMFILIQYFALRSEAGKYLGTLEVSQEISDIKSLEGEKRLLDE